MLRPVLPLVLAAVALGVAVATGCNPEPSYATAAGGPGAGEASGPARRPHALGPVPTGLALPADAVYVPGGRTLVGAEDGAVGMPHERPAFEAEVAGFLLDRAPVTVVRFRRFVAATGHVTDAERFGDGGVLDRETSARTGAAAWTLAPGADWRRPLGPDGPPAPDDHPVTQVSWADADAFCRWNGAQRGFRGRGRLPTEVEWEHAARGARNAPGPYAWSGAGDGPDTLEGSDGRPRANTWEGAFPVQNSGADGHLRTSPAGAFGETPLGLQDMGGNVWEWTGSWYRPYPLTAEADAASAPPPGPSGAPERVQRGGSYLCNPSWCHGYRVSARSHATPETALEHVGFRCAYDAPPAPPAGATPSPPTDG